MFAIGLILGLAVGSPGQPVEKASDFPCYERDIKPVLEARCLACHSEDGEDDLRGFKNASEHSYGILREVAGGNMPLAKPLPQKERDLFKAWNQHGSPACK